MQMALEQNLGIKIAEADRDISESGIQSSKSAFDTLLEFNIDHLIDQNARAIAVIGTDNRTTNYNLGLSKILPSGTRARLEWLNQRNSTNSLFATLNPFYESSLNFSIEQPLLQNTFGLQDRGQVSIARKRYESVDASTQRRVSELVFQILSDYWSWRIDQEQVKVTKQSLTEAKRFEKLSKEKEKFGLHESTDVLNAKANRLSIQNQLKVVELRRDDSHGRLIRDLNIEKSTALSSTEQAPFSQEVPDLENTLLHALEHRRDYQAGRRDLERREIEVSLAKNSRWPELDLLASLKLNGVEESYNDALSDATSADNPAFFIGGAFSFPLENRRGRSATKQANLEKMKSLYQLKDLENRITQEVEEQWRALDTAIEVVLLNRRIVNVQREKWHEELKKYRTGRSSSDLVVRFHEDYLHAQRVQLEALLQYRLAVLGLRLAQNTLIP